MQAPCLAPAVASGGCQSQGGAKYVVKQMQVLHAGALPRSCRGKWGMPESREGPDPPPWRLRGLGVSIGVGEHVYALF